MDVIQFLSAFGLGAIITTAVQAWLSMRADNAKRNFQEKKEAYVGLLDALHQSELAQTEVASKYVGHWMSRIELVGSKKVYTEERPSASRSTRLTALSEPSSLNSWSSVFTLL